jgi:polyhydroxyalkanoate synthesis regulator protein
MTGPPLVIERYARSRLYDPAGRRYVTIELLRQWKRNGVAFIVIEVETGLDVTRVLLA